MLRPLHNHILCFGINMKCRVNCAASVCGSQKSFHMQLWSELCLQSAAADVAHHHHHVVWWSWTVEGTRNNNNKTLHCIAFTFKICCGSWQWNIIILVFCCFYGLCYNVLCNSIDIWERENFNRASNSIEWKNVVFLSNIMAHSRNEIKMTDMRTMWTATEATKAPRHKQKHTIEIWVTCLNSVFVVEFCVHLFWWRCEMGNAPASFYEIVFSFCLFG